MFHNNFKLSSDEKILYVIRKHIFFLIFDTLGVFLLFILPTIFIWVLQYNGYISEFKIFGVSFYSLTDVFIYMWAIFCWLELADKFTDYSLDIWILTNKRIVESELIKLFDRKIATLELQDIEDITVRSGGFWANYFGYGRIDVQTAGTVTEFYFDHAANPEKMQSLIFDAKLKDEQERKNIEKGEVEQISHRVVHEEVPAENLFAHIPHDQKVEQETSAPSTLPTSDFDWAHIAEKQAGDIRNLQTQVEELDDKYKKGIDNALRSE